MAGEAEVQAQGGEVVVLPEKIQRTRQAQPQLVAIQGQAFDLLEDLGQVHGGAAHLCGDLGQRPAACQITGEHELGPVHQALASDTGAGDVRGARPQRPLHQGQGQGFRFQGFRSRGSAMLWCRLCRRSAMST